MIWPILFAIAIGVAIWKLFLDGEKNPLDELPGPDRKPFIGCVLAVLSLEPPEVFVLVRQLFKQHGDRFLIKIFNRRILHVNSPKDIEIVVTHSKNITKNLPYTFLQPWLGTGLLLSTGSKWHKRRKILTPTFHFNILKNFSITMEEKSKDFIGRLKKTNGADVDVMAEVSDFTLFTICETAMGTQLDQDQSAKTVEYKAAIQDIGKLMINRLTNVWLQNDFIFSKSAKGKLYNECLEKVHNFADNVISERRKQKGSNTKDFTAALKGEDISPKKRLAMLDLLLEAQDKGEIDAEGIREEVNTFMFEGYDTTAMALTYALMLLADHEDVQNRIYEECQGIIGDSDRMPTMADWAAMKYLDAVIKETLRLYPSVPLFARMITEDFMMGDLQVKKGSEVACHVYDLHRRADLYPEPEEFRPDRFLSGEVRHPYAYVPFSAGLRNCIGQKFAMLEMKCVLSDICRTFKLQPKTKGARPDLTADLVLRPIYTPDLREVYSSVIFIEMKYVIISNGILRSNFAK